MFGKIARPIAIASFAAVVALTIPIAAQATGPVITHDDDTSATASARSCSRRCGRLVETQIRIHVEAEPDLGALLPCDGETLME
jgi:hypothetical protein